MTILAQPTEQTWLAANQAFLQMALRTVRLRLQRRVRWLRQHWVQAGVDPLQGFASVVTDRQADWLLIGEDWGAEYTFYAHDAQARQISAEIEAWEKQMGQEEERWLNAGIPLPATTLAQLCNLSQFEQQLLWLCLAPLLDGSFAPLFAYVQDNASQTVPTLHLAISLFAVDEETRHLAMNSLLPTAPLRRFSLLQQDDTLSIAPRVADFLRGVQEVDSALVGMLKSVEAVYLPASHLEIAHQLSQWLGKQSGAMVVNLVGKGDVDGVAEHICRHLSLQIFKLDIETIVQRTQTTDLQLFISLWLREAILLPCAYFINLTSLDSTQQKVAQRVVDQFPTLLFVHSEQPIVTTRPTLSQAIVRPNNKEQAVLWRQALGNLRMENAGIQKLVQQFDFGGRTIQNVVNAAQRQAQLRSPNNGVTVQLNDLWQAGRAHASPQLAQLAQPIAPIFTWDDIILPNDLLAQLHEIEAQVAHRHQVYEEWGFAERLSRGRGISALFAGPSGTGKTMAAEILANGLHLDLYRIDLSGVVSKYIGETEKNLKQVFDAAEASGAILFFDEADALFGKRTEVKDSHDRYANIEINYLLQRMEEYRGLAILATNRKSDLDRAFLRRLRYLLDFPFPDFRQRERIWRKAFPTKTPLADLDFEVLARLEVSGGNIKNIALNGAFLAANAKTAITMSHLMQSARREYAKIDKMVRVAEFGEFYETG